MDSSTSRRTHNRLSIRLKLFTACSLTILLVSAFTIFASFPGLTAKTATPDPSAGKNNSKPESSAIGLLQPQELDTPHTLAAAYYSLKADLSATLMLSNQGPHPMPVQIKLFSLTGEQFDIEPITLNSNEARAFDLRSHMPAGSTFEEGSLQVSYSGKSMGLGGVVNLVNAARSIIFDEELTEPADMFKSSRLEGVWWLPSSDSEMQLVVSNTTDAPLSATVSVDGIGAKQKETIEVALRSHETRVISMKEILGKPARTLSRGGGISITHTGTEGALLARAMIQNLATGYSNVIEFSDPQRAKSSKLNGAGLRVGKIGEDDLTQVVVARNVSDTRTVLTGRIPYTTTDGKTGVADLRAVRLAPGQIRELDITAALNRSGVKEVAAAGLEFEHTGAPGGVVLTALSVSATGTQVFRVPLSDANLLSGTGTYPWSLDGNSSAVVYIKNVTDSPREYTMDIEFEGGAYVFGVKQLAAGRTVAINIRDLRDDQVPDVYGKTIPSHITNGKAYWSLRGTVPHTLIGRVEQVDFVQGLSSTAACGACCPDNFANAIMDPSYVTGFIGDVSQFTVYQQNADYHGNPRPWFPVSASFFSTDSSVATINSSGLATAVGGGLTFIEGRLPATTWRNCAGESGGDEYCCEPIDNEYTCTSTCEVAPQVTISGNQTMKDGDFFAPSFTVTVQGGTPTSYQWSFEAPPGAGNNPNVTFESPNSATTTARGRWFALPNSECGASYDATYTIRCTVNFSGGSPQTVSAQLTVNAYWNPAGAVGTPQITGGPTYAYDTSRGLWFVTGPGSLARNVPSPVINVPFQSQFYNKTVVHEDVHVQQWSTGLYADLYTISSLMSALNPITDPTESGFISKINQASIDWVIGEEVSATIRVLVSEREAYNVSDAFAPRYLYQNCGRF